MRGVSGFRSYGVMDTGGGLLTVTSAASQEGTGESTTRAAEFIKANLPEGVSVAPPQVIEGEGIWRFEADGVPPSGAAHVAVRIFNAPRQN
jgi:hypothetical protein